MRTRRNRQPSIPSANVTAPDRAPALTGEQMRELIGLALMVLGALGLLVIAFLVHLLAGAALLCVVFVAAGWAFATTDDGEAP